MTARHPDQEKVTAAARKKMNRQETNLRECAEAAARAAGLHALHNTSRRAEIVQRSAHDVKLALDAECQAAAEKVIRSKYPAAHILGEEGTRTGEASSDLTWIIDPLDGSVNFSHGIPVWCSSVAAVKDGVTVAGAVYVPLRDECFTATVNGPALLNGRPIAPSSTADPARALVLTGLSKKIHGTHPGLQILNRLAVGVQKVRVMGAAAIDICHVACGRADAYIEPSIYLWDVAAAGLIARRAGAVTEVIEQYDEVHLFYMCTSGPDLHRHLKNIALE